MIDENEMKNVCHFILTLSTSEYIAIRTNYYHLHYDVHNFERANGETPFRQKE